MSVNYQEFTDIRAETGRGDSPGHKTRLAGMFMGRRIPEPSTANICLLTSLCTGLTSIIIILVVTITRQGVEQTQDSLEVKLRNLSIEVHSRVDRLYVDSYRMMEKLVEFEDFMQNFRKQDVTTKVKSIESMVKFFLSDEIAGSLASDNQRILGAVGHLTDGIRNKNGTLDPLCDPGWTHFGLSCYFLARNPRPWAYAKQHCEDKKGHLVVVNSLEEKNFLGNFSHSDSLWIGLYAEGGVWKWVDGTSYERSPKFWKSHRPMWGLTEPMCAVLEGGEGWADWFCSSSYQYVCEKKISRKP